MRRDLSASALAFKDVVWPQIAPLCGGGLLRPVEGEASTEMERDLDMLAGIDAWQIVSGRGIRGVASRVQKTDTRWDTFTTRYSRESGAETEYAKRLRSITSCARPR